MSILFCTALCFRDINSKQYFCPCALLFISDNINIFLGGGQGQNITHALLCMAKTRIIRQRLTVEINKK